MPVKELINVHSVAENKFCKLSFVMCDQSTLIRIRHAPQQQHLRVLHISCVFIMSHIIIEIQCRVLSLWNSNINGTNLGWYSVKQVVLRSLTSRTENQKKVYTSFSSFLHYGGIYPNESG